MTKPKREAMSNNAAKNGRKRTATEADTTVDVVPKRRKVQTAKSTKQRRPTRVDKNKVNEIVRYTEKGYPLVIGQGEMGQLGLGEDINERAKPALVTIAEPVIQVCAGGLHTAILTVSGKVFTFGCNDEGALGRNTDAGEEFMPCLVVLSDKIVQISAGDSHTAALTENGCVYAWGEFRDSSGSMGLTSKGPQKVPMLVMSEHPIAKIVSGSNHLVCLSQDGILYTCGCAEQGQLGRIPDCFSLRGGRRGPDLVLTLSPVCIGKLKNQSVLFDDVWAGSYVTFARQLGTGNIYAFGLNNYSQLGLPKSDKPVFIPTIVKSFAHKILVQMASGQHHSLALTDKGKVYALGRKEYGRLGLGEHCEDANEPTLIETLADKKCVAISCGENVSYAVTDDGIFYGWGMANTNQLGTKDDEDDVWEPLEIKGKQLENRRVLNVSGGGQHTILLAQDKVPLKNGQAKKH